MAEPTVENNCGIDWQKQCLALETQLFKFRLQASKIRELLAEKMQELEQRVVEAEQRARSAEKQVQIMEEKLKLANVKNSASSEHKKYQELMSKIQEKDELINKLESQLKDQKQLRAQEAKTVQEKAAKIKDWVTAKLRELEQENHYLKGCNLKLTEQIKALQEALQVVDLRTVPSAESVSNSNIQLLTDPLSSLFENVDQDSSILAVDIKQAYQGVSTKGIPYVTSVVLMDDAFVTDEANKSVSSQSKLSFNSYTSKYKSSSMNDLVSVTDPNISPASLNVQAVKCQGILAFQSPLEELQSSVRASNKRVSDLHNLSDELSNKFNAHRLNPSEEIKNSLNSSVSVSISALPLPKSITSIPSNFPGREGELGNSMTLPEARTLNNPRDSIQLAKRHYSQPQSRTDSFHHKVNIEISTFQPVRAATQCQGQVEETDIDEELIEKMDMEDYLVDEAGKGEETRQRVCSSKEAGTTEDRVVDSGGKPPTPPLHRFPSWESRIYAVAKSGMRLSETAHVRDSKGQTSNSPICSPSGPFTCLIYRNVTVPVYTVLKGKATQISSGPFLDESSSSDDDCNSHVNIRTSNAGFEPRKSSRPGSPRAVKRAGVSMSSLSSEGDYAIPPDAYSLDEDYSEPEHKLQRTSTYSADGVVCSEPLEKSGYLLKMSNQVKTWKRRWFVLRNGQIMYYKSPSDVICKPQGQVELDSSCQIVRGEGSQTFQLITEKRIYFLTADSPNILEEWIHVLQSILKVQVTSASESPLGDVKPTVKGWLTKVKHGRSKMVWCSLVGKTFCYYRNHEDKCPLGYLHMTKTKVEEVDHSCDSDEDYETNGGGLLSSHCTLVIHPPDQSPTYLLIGTKQEKDTWLYHLTVAAGISSARVGTAYEQLIGQLLDAGGDLNSPLWKHPMLCYSKDGLHTPLTTLPSEALQTEALKLFKSCQLFINVPVEASSIDYHVSLAQTALQVCLTHSELQNEIYCQLIKQTSRQAQNHPAIQCWQLLALCAPLFLPQHHFLWYLKQHLQQHADPRSEIGKYAIYCQRSVERTLQAREREARPSRMEIVSILLRNPYHHSLPFSIPVHFLNGTYQVVGFDGSSTVDEFLHQLNQETGMRPSSQSGFSLFTDDPSGRDLEHCLQSSMKVCDVISKWEQALKELNPGKYEGGTRIVKLTYKNRQLADRLATKWMVLQGCSQQECVRIYLTVARKWPLFGAKLFTAKPILSSLLEDCPLWIAVNQDGISILEYNTMVRSVDEGLAILCSDLFSMSFAYVQHLKLAYSYSSVLTFGGCQEDFMVVVSQRKDSCSGKTTPEKLLFSMAAPKVSIRRLCFFIKQFLSLQISEYEIQTDSGCSLLWR
ncbi:hypothetical protein lerEdw1_017222 [Lerista edwardsae]|nr:hypothetical protein lerEdw1_017222 [Lerista edwardsae]